MQLGLTTYYALSNADTFPRTLPGPAVLVYEASILLSKQTAPIGLLDCTLGSLFAYRALSQI